MYRYRSIIMLACLSLSSLHPRCCRAQGVHPQDPLHSTPIIVLHRYHKQPGYWEHLQSNALGVFKGGTSRAGQEVLLEATEQPSLPAGATYRWSVGKQPDEAVADFLYSDEDADKIPKDGKLYISPRKGGPVPLTTDTTQIIRFYWVNGNPEGLHESVDCFIFGGNGNLAGPWKSATASMTVYKPQLLTGGLYVHNNPVNIVSDALYYGVYPTEETWYKDCSDFSGETARANCSGTGVGPNDRYFWAQLLTLGATKQREEGTDRKVQTVWSVNGPTLDGLWPCTENRPGNDGFFQARLNGPWLMDSPHTPTPADDIAAVGLYERFRSWFMYQPVPGNDGPLTIPVPIMSFEWAWFANEMKDPKTKEWKLGHRPDEVDTWPNIEEIDSTLEYPKWNQVIRGDFAPEGNFKTGPGDNFIVPYTPSAP